MQIPDDVDQNMITGMTFPASVDQHLINAMTFPDSDRRSPRYKKARDRSRAFLFHLVPKGGDDFIRSQELEPLRQLASRG
jgi:hypothetical protein